MASVLLFSFLSWSTCPTSNYRELPWVCSTIFNWLKSPQIHHQQVHMSVATALGPLRWQERGTPYSDPVRRSCRSEVEILWGFEHHDLIRRRWWRGRNLPGQTRFQICIEQYKLQSPTQVWYVLQTSTCRPFRTHLHSSVEFHVRAFRQGIFKYLQNSINIIVLACWLAVVALVLVHQHRWVISSLRFLEFTSVWCRKYLKAASTCISDLYCVLAYWC